MLRKHKPVTLGDWHCRHDVGGGVGAHDQVDTVLADELLIQRGHVVGYRFVVSQIPLDRPAEEATALVEAIDKQLPRDLVDDARWPEGPGQGECAPDHNRVATGFGLCHCGLGPRRRLGGGRRCCGRRRSDGCSFSATVSTGSNHHAQSHHNG